PFADTLPSGTETLTTSFSANVLKDSSGRSWAPITAVVPDVGHHLALLPGLDILSGGPGDDRLIGDDIVLTRPYRPGAFDAMNSLGQAMDDLARVHRPQAQTRSMGNDTLHGDGGNDLLVGDSEVLIAASGPETQPVDAHVLETAEHLRASVHALSQSTQGTVRPDVLLRGTDVL